MTHPYPGHDQKPGIVGQQPRIPFPLSLAPSDESIPVCGLPCRRSEEQTGRRSAFGVVHQIFEILSNAVVMSQVMITMEQKLEQREALILPGQRLDLQRKHGTQTALNRAAIMGHFADQAVAVGVGIGTLSMRKPDPSPSLQFEQKGAAGHVLQPTLVVAPSPSFAQFPGESRAIPLPVFGRQGTDQLQIPVGDTAALNDPFGLHRSHS